MDKRTVGKDLKGSRGEGGSKDCKQGKVDSRGGCLSSVEANANPEFNPATSSRLTAAQQQLLMKFYDQECSFLESVRVRLLLHVEKGAQLFLDGHRQNQENSRCSVAMRAIEQKNRSIPGGSLWPGISLGISQEQRLRSVSLGVIPSIEVSKSKGEWASRFSWGISGAVVASGVIFVATSIFDLKVGQKGNANRTGFGGLALGRQLESDPSFAFQANRKMELGSVNVNDRRMVVLEGAREGMPVRLVRAPRVKAPRSSAQVEWLRTNGKPTYIRDPHHGAPIIWIRRMPKVVIPSHDKSPDDWSPSKSGKQSEPYTDFE